jgi:hypothetical protein
MLVWHHTPNGSMRPGPPLPSTCSIPVISWRYAAALHGASAEVPCPLQVSRVCQKVFLNQTTVQGERNLATPAAGASANLAASTSDAATPLDQFTPSSLTETASATAEAAGLFTPAQFSLFSPAADSLLAQAAAATTTAAAQSAATLGRSASAAASGDSNTVTTAATDAGNGAAASSVNTATATASLAQPTGTAATTTVNASSANAASAASPGALTVAAQLQTLNSSRAALGLSPSDIQKVDQIAGLINDFNPTSFTSLVYQLEALALNAAPQATQTPAARDRTASAAAGPQPGTTVATAAPTRAANAGATFANGNGKTVQVRSTNASSVPGQTKAATA